ncbi:Pr6Pr family membrane protein [Sphingobacterium faecium]|uniref:Pr6Pr family membrane protein n=1 Tax=Sphingobacterium faecium TaxID=34087 RepID=UPI0032090083
MKQTALPQNVKGLNAVVLIIMTIVTLDSIEPWTAWNVDPTSPGYGWNRFSYFTIQSNFIAMVTYLIAAVAIFRNKQLGEWFRYLRAGAVLYMMVTGIVFAVLLRNTQLDPDHFSWSNFILHEFGPFFITVWWLLWPSRKPITSGKAFYLLIFPFLWVIYTFIRASITGWYPYPFLDPATAGGTAGVMTYVCGLTIFFVVLCQLLAWISRARENNNTLY